MAKTFEKIGALDDLVALGEKAAIVRDAFEEYSKIDLEGERAKLGMLRDDIARAMGDADAARQELAKVKVEIEQKRADLAALTVEYDNVKGRVLRLVG
jgi:hypothetical protein